MVAVYIVLVVLKYETLNKLRYDKLMPKLHSSVVEVPLSTFK